ncbi:DNA methyltransferase [Candidatus Electronema sp. JM]|uniref:DNA methyltransferase n=1 Tax=Candidatus Electronema sp. JM TaxID=3401571 RepID=UPI003AA9BC19
MKNHLYYGDNLKILREYIRDESVDLIYLDPPFNSNRSYNVLFKDESGRDSEAQLTAFEDTWHWDMAAAAVYEKIVTSAPANVATMIGALREFIGANQMMAYLVMMTARLLELHRVLKPTGSLYLHCDPTASHYLKIVLDAIFGIENYKNEIIWQRINAKGNVQKKFGAVHDSILFYAKKIGTEQWNQVCRSLNPEYVEKTYRYIEEETGRRYMSDNLTASMSRASSGQIYEWKGKKPPATRCWVYAKEKMEELDRQGRILYSKTGYPRFKRYLDENAGEKIPDIWTDIHIAQGKESLGYPTQKPVALLERILEASSNEGDIVLDPFCGCGTTIHAAQKLKRQWIGIDITHLAIALQKYRLKDAFGIVEKYDYDVVGEPESLADARQLASDDRYQFQWWALSLIQAQPAGGEAGSKQGKKGKDRGIDGIITFIDDAKGKPKCLIVQVKSGKVKSGDIRDLVGTIERENAAVGVFITLENPTKDMKTEAASAGFYHSPDWNRDYPKIQIMTIEELLAGAAVQMPGKAQTYKKAQREREKIGIQKKLF